MRITFRAGKVITESTGKLRGKRKLNLGNGWRGVLVITGVVLLARGLGMLGAIILGLAALWSIIENALRHWRTIYIRQRALTYLKRGLIQEALDLTGTPEPSSELWWCLLAELFKQLRWQEAAAKLEEIPQSEQRAYLMAITKLGQNQPREALSLCPPSSDGRWKTLRAEAYFQMKEWQKVLGVLRGKESSAARAEQMEHAWLKGGSYFFLNQLKPAIKLLRTVADKGGEGFESAEEWLREAAAKV